MCTLLGMKFFSNDMLMFDSMRTNVVANPMESPLMALVVVAKVGQHPSRSTKIGFSLKNPFVKLFQFAMIKILLCCFQMLIMRDLQRRRKLLS